MTCDRAALHRAEVPPCQDLTATLCRGPTTTPCYAARSAEPCLCSWTTLLCRTAHPHARHDSLSRNRKLSSFTNTHSFSFSPFFRLVQSPLPIPAANTT